MSTEKRRLPAPPDEEVINHAALQDDEALPEDDFAEFDEEEDDGAFAAEVEALNDPEVEYLSDPPRIGGGTKKGVTEDLYGNDAHYAIGRAMSPRLYAQAAQFPTCVQLRVWKWENGVPVGLGAIDATATEEDLVRQFASAMPKKGESRGQFKLRPIDIRGHELGQEVTLIISEHHSAVQTQRAVAEEESQSRDIHVHGGGGGGEGYGEMGRMFEQALDASEQRNNVLQNALEVERERIRQEDVQRAQERVDLATNAAQGVQALTERMMADESGRAERSMKMQNEHSNMLLTTLTGIFQQQQSMAHQSSDQQRRADEFRLEQERQRADRERQEAGEKARNQQQEWDRKRQKEREEGDGRLRLEREEAQRRFEQYRLDLDARLQREQADQARKERTSREDAERRDKWMAEERSRRESREAEQSRTRDADRQRQHERMMKEVEMSAQRDREHSERMMQISKMEMASQGQANGMNVLGNAAGLLKQFGVEPTDILPRLFSPEEDEKAGWMDALPKMLGAAAEFAKANMQGKAQDAEMAQLAMAQQAQLSPPPMDFGPLPPPGAGEMYGMPSGMGPGMGPDEPDPAESFEDEVPIPRETPAQANSRMLSEMAEEGGVPLLTQKNARVSIRKLVRSLKTSKSGTWEGKILSALQEELAIYHYIKAVTVRAAITEAGADAELCDRICTLVQSSALVPSDVPLG